MIQHRASDIAMLPTLNSTSSVFNDLALAWYRASALALLPLVYACARSRPRFDFVLLLYYSTVINVSIAAPSRYLPKIQKSFDDGTSPLLASWGWWGNTLTRRRTSHVHAQPSTRNAQTSPFTT